ncbi:MAG: R3H domain-containing nucleic acid-binding protein [Candidatus Promineifilaceae bacterium]|nr:R3H domain-containing nucleic acid-binding protein [Candidatus Promineifilaceae bacterium]
MTPSDATALQQAREDLDALLAVLPVSIRERIDELGNEVELLEVVMDLGRRPTARYTSGEVTLRNEEVTKAEIDAVVNRIGEFDEDNRAGMPRTLHRISAIRNRRGNIVGLTARVGRAVYGTIDIIADLVESRQGILLLGRPGVGKTTMLREMARVLAETRRVVIVDTSNEIGGDGDIPHPAVGRARRMQVPRPSRQHETMIEAVENHNPEAIIIDEIGREQEAAAARTINERGVQLIGTAHGNTLENLLLNPTLSDLVGGIESVTLSDEEARRRGTQKTVLERRAPPTFDVLIEIQERQRVLVHPDVASSVDAVLRGEAMAVELRYRDDDGQIHVEREQATVETPALSGRRGSRDTSGGRPTVRRQRATTSSEPNGGSRTTATVVGEQRSRTATRRVFPYGVARNRLRQAARKLGVDVDIVENVDEAHVLITLKNYYRRRRRVISDAEQRRIPIYVLRANTVSQMEHVLAEIFNLEATSSDPFELAVAEAERAIERILAGEESVDLSPAGSSIRRYQHQLARQANLVSHSYGSEPNRHVRIFGTPRNRS